MHLQVTEYWKEVKKTEAEIEAAAAKQQLQPRGGSVYVVTIGRARETWRPGVITEATVRLAAQCVVNGTHELASDTQIQAHLDEDKKRQETVRAAARGRNVMQFTTPPVNEG